MRLIASANHRVSNDRARCNRHKAIEPALRPHAVTHEIARIQNRLGILHRGRKFARLRDRGSILCTHRADSHCVRLAHSGIDSVATSRVWHDDARDRVSALGLHRCLAIKRCSHRGGGETCHRLSRKKEPSSCPLCVTKMVFENADVYPTHLRLAVRSEAIQLRRRARRNEYTSRLLELTMAPRTIL